MSKRKKCKKCPHGRQPSKCKECGGVGICEHGRRRTHCKECGGSAICIHGRQRQTCKECGGVSICIHQRRRQQCKECGERDIFKKGGFSKEEIQQVGAVKHCQFPGCGAYSESLHSDHDHACCPLSKLCTECYRGELCANHNMWMGTFDAHPEWATSEIREYLSRRPYARKPRFLLLGGNMKVILEGSWPEIVKQFEEMKAGTPGVALTTATVAIPAPFTPMPDLLEAPVITDKKAAKQPAPPEAEQPVTPAPVTVAAETEPAKTADIPDNSAEMPTAEEYDARFAIYQQYLTEILPKHGLVSSIGSSYKTKMRCYVLLRMGVRDLRKINNGQWAELLAHLQNTPPAELVALIEKANA